MDLLSKRGVGLRYMDRENDYYSWTCLILTSPNIMPKNLYQFAKVHCLGSIICRNDSCPQFKSSRERNQVSWSRRLKGDCVFKVGEAILEGVVVCFHYGIPPICDESCPAQMFYMYPIPSIDWEKLKYMSRIAIHVSSHIHQSHNFVP